MHGRIRLARRWNPKTAARIALAAFVIFLGAAASAHAQAARFKQINDAVPAKFFEAATSAADPSNPNRLIIGFDTGLDPATFQPVDFLAFSNRVAMDTISFVVKAPVGYYISKITYTQRGAGATSRTSVEAGAATWVVAGHSASLGTFRSDPNLTGTADVTAMHLTSVPVSITLSLFASTGAISVTSADVMVQLVPR